MTEDVLVPGSRDVRATLSAPDADTCVVACPPHPQYGGSRSDERLRAVVDALAERGIACLRFDYGAWDEGRGERTDAGNAIAWARQRFDRVGLFGYSFGAAVALAVAGGGQGEGRLGEGRPDGAEPLCCVSVLAPPARLDSLDVVEAVDEIEAPTLVLYGERDTTVDWEPVVGVAGERGADVVALDGDHFFAGTLGEIGGTVAEFVAERC